MGTGSRAEKIKTYNYKDSRVSDHRTKVNFDLEKVRATMSSLHVLLLCKHAQMIDDWL